jgi:hypothetical protein
MLSKNQWIPVKVLRTAFIDWNDPVKSNVRISLNRGNGMGSFYTQYISIAAGEKNRINI